MNETTIHEDINYVKENIKYFLYKNKKSENDIFNQIRERIIKIFLMRYNDVRFSYSIDDDGRKLFENFKRTMSKIGVREIVKTKSIGGRNNVDFHIEYLNSMKEKIEMELEFKNGSLSVEKLPQFLQLYTTNKSVYLFDEPYHEYYYQYYLPKILKLLEERDIHLELPKYDEYLKHLNDTTKKNTFHYKLYQAYKKHKEINDIVKESIDEYLKKVGDKVNIGILNRKLREQKNKVYLMTCNGKFVLEQVKDYMRVRRFKYVKNKNTIVLEGGMGCEIHCLLRWKNGNGVRGPAWQISLKKGSVWNELDDLEKFVLNK